MPEDAWLTGFLLSFGPQVDVLAPDHLRHELARQAKMIYEKKNPDTRCQGFSAILPGKRQKTMLDGKGETG